MNAARSKPGLSGKGLAGLALLLGGALLLGALAAIPFIWYRTIQADLAERRTELRFIEARISAAAGGRRTGLTAADDPAPIFVSGITAGLGNASLQRLVDRLARENGMSVERIQPLITEETAGLATLRMEVETTGSLENLRDFLVALETGTPLIFVNQARIATAENTAGDSTALPSDALNVALQLEAFGWREPQP